MTKVYFLFAVDDLSTTVMSTDVDLEILQTAREMVNKMGYSSIALGPFKYELHTLHDIDHIREDGYMSAELVRWLTPGEEEWDEGPVEDEFLQSLTDLIHVYRDGNIQIELDGNYSEAISLDDLQAFKPGPIAEPIARPHTFTAYRNHVVRQAQSVTVEALSRPAARKLAEEELRANRGEITAKVAETWTTWEIEN